MVYKLWVLSGLLKVETLILSSIKWVLKFMIAQVYDATDYGTVFVEVERTGDNTVDVVFGSAVTDGDYYLTLQATAFQSHGDGGGVFKMEVEVNYKTSINDYREGQ